MNNLQVIEQNGVRVLTSLQLADAYGTNRKVISNNFARNFERYTKNKHYIALSGKEKHEFLNHHQIEDGSRNANVFYLWTEKGAWLQAKSLNTDEAWDAYEMLVDDYYTKQQQIKVLSEREQLMASMKLSIELAEEFTAVKQDVTELKKVFDEELTLNHGQQQVLHHEIKKRVENIYGNYADDITKQGMYSQIHKQLRRAFSAPKYIFVKRKDYEEAIAWVKAWRPLF